MDTPKNLTEEQRRIFLKYDSIPAGFSRAEMIELTGQNNQMNDRRYEHKEPITEKNFYKHCEICKRILPHKFYPPGQRFRNRHSEAGIGKSGRGYCHICHKSRCFRCSVGILCKNCLGFFPEATKKKFLTYHKWWHIIRFTSFLLAVFSLVAVIPNIPLSIPHFGLPKLVIAALFYFSYIFPGLSMYYIFTYYENTTKNFLDDLKANPEQHEGKIKEIYGLHFDSFDHPESRYELKSRLIFNIITGIGVGTFLMFAVGFF